MNTESCSFPGALPSGLLSSPRSFCGFEKPLGHIRTRASSPFSSTSTDHHFIPFCWDILGNLSMNRQDSRVVLNRGFQVADTDSGLEVNGKSNSSLHDSIDSKKMVKNLCSSQKYKKMTEFLTLTCNMKKHFGIKNIKVWIDGIDWKKCYAGYYDLDSDAQQEISIALTQAAAPLLLRNWMEVRACLLRYIYKSIYSPFHPCDTIFARDEYQDSVGNLPHIHALIGMDRKRMTDEQLRKIDELIRGSYGDIVKMSDIEELVNENIISSIDDKFEIEEDAKRILKHTCSDRCLKRIGSSGTDSDFVCRKLNYFKASPDNTRPCVVPLGNKRSPHVVEILEKIGLFEPIQVNEYGHVAPFKSKHPYFHPCRHIPPTTGFDDINMSPVETKLFCTCRSMQNLQSLICTNGTNKYVCKYCAKLDQQNYVVVKSHAHDAGVLKSKFNFLHNTKIKSSSIHEENMLKKSRDYNLPRGRAISLMQMIQQIHGYPEVFTDMNFISIATVPLEERTGIELPPKDADPSFDEEIETLFGNNEDGIDLSIPSEVLRRRVLNLADWRQHSTSELHIIDSCLRSSISLDSITKFSIRPPELKKLIREVGQYYRWFKVGKKLSYKQCKESISNDVCSSMWIDGVQRQIKIRRKALPEIKIFLSTLTVPVERYDPLNIMLTLFKDIIRIYELKENGSEMTDTDKIKFRFMESSLIYDDSERHLPIPVFSFIKPHMGTRFLLHIMLSMGKFDTEYDLNLHCSLRESLRYASLIGPNNDRESLERYSDQLLHKYITEQLVFFPNGASVTDTWIVNAKHIFDDVIIHDRISHTEMPPLLQADLEREKNEAVDKLFDSFKDGIISSAFEEMKDVSDLFNVPSKENLMNVKSLHDDLNWDALGSFKQSLNQSDESHKEQKKALKMAIDTIDQYSNVNGSDGSLSYFTRSVVIAGAPGSGKSFLNLYILLYVISKGLRVCSTSVMAKRSNSLGGLHIHMLFQLPIKNIASLHRLAELAANGLMRKPEYLKVLQTLNVLFIDEIGQVSSELLSTLDILLRYIRNSNIFFGGLLIIASLDHRQLPPVKGRQFLMSPHCLTCFRFSVLQHSVRASCDPSLQRIIQIARMHHTEYNEDILQEFRDLARNGFTFVPNWQHPLITPDVFRILSRKKSSQEACDEYISQVKYQMHETEYIQIHCTDLQNPVHSLMDWVPALEIVSKSLDKKTKEPRCLLFFVGAVFEFTYNERGKFSQSQLAVMMELPEVQDNGSFEKISLYIAPPGVKEYVYSSEHTCSFLESKGWKRESIGCVPERIYSLPNAMKGKRRQYGLKHRVTATIHACQGDTLHKLVTQISSRSAEFNIWDKAQVVVLLSRTRRAEDMIFVGSAENTINCLIEKMKTRSQNTDYMEKVISLLDSSSSSSSLNLDTSNVFTYSDYPYDFNNIELPDCHTGFVYFLISLKDINKSYIGQTFDLRSRLRAHNSGNGTSFTDLNRPWALYAYIIGFDNNRHKMMSIENSWEYLRIQAVNNGVRDPKQLVLSGLPLVHASDGKLKMICHFH